MGFLIFALVLNLFSCRRWITFLILTILTFTSVPATSNFLWSYLERDYGFQRVEALHKKDAAVVLSGMLNIYRDGDQEIVEWSDPDRFFAGVKILENDKADYIIFTRGRLPWKTNRPEGEVLKLKAIEFGIERERVLLTTTVENTYQEALAVKKIMRDKNLKTILLITSAYHMKRAKYIFDSVGIDAIPYATDFTAKGKQLYWDSLIPNAQAFGKFSRGLRELLGRIYYQVTL